MPADEFYAGDGGSSGGFQLPDGSVVPSGDNGGLISYSGGASGSVTSRDSRNVTLSDLFRNAGLGAPQSVSNPQLSSVYSNGEQYPGFNGLLGSVGSFMGGFFAPQVQQQTGQLLRLPIQGNKHPKHARRNAAALMALAASSATRNLPGARPALSSNVILYGALALGAFLLLKGR